MRGYNPRKELSRAKLSRSDKPYKSRQRWYSYFDDRIDYSEVSPEQVFIDTDTFNMSKVSLRELDAHIKYYRKVLDKISPYIDRLYAGRERSIYNAIETEWYLIEKAIDYVVNFKRNAIRNKEVMFEDLVELSRNLWTFDYSFNSMIDLLKVYEERTGIKVDERIIKYLLEAAKSEIPTLYVPVPNSRRWYLWVQPEGLKFVDINEI